MTSLSITYELNVHPMIALKRGLMLVKPLLEGRCCGKGYDEEEIHENIEENLGQAAKCLSCGTSLYLWLRINWWSYPEMRVSYFTSEAVLQTLQQEIFLPEQLDMIIAPSPLLASARYHFGSLRNAYKQVGVDYPHAEIADWQEAVIPFLGTVPDGVLAELINVSPWAVKRLRRHHEIRGVRGYNKWKKIDVLKIESRIRRGLRKQPQLIKAERQTIH